MSIASLDSLVKLNVNAIAVVPYTFMRDPEKVTALPIPDRKGMEHDAGVIHTSEMARERGLRVMLKPQIWVGRDSWPGDIRFGTDAEWTEFFGHYGQWILHYAELAETHKMDALCIGTELRHTTLERPDDWRRLIREIRKVYSGRLTYAANWGDEFEGITFWDALDVIGLNNYYPLSERAEATDQELLGSARYWFRMAARVSDRYDRPIWLTETGFRSVTAPWVSPHAEAGEREPSDTDQARAYRALLTAAGECDRLTGIFIWKWPSYLGRGQARRRNPGTGFTPGGKPAGTILTTFYADWRQ